MSVLDPTREPLGKGLRCAMQGSMQGGMQETASVQVEAVVKPDWMLVQALYFQGKTPKQIEGETGVKAQSVSVRATRHGWTRSLAKTRLALKGAEDKPKEGKLDSASEAVRNALGRDLKRVCDLIDTSPPSSLPKALKRQQAMVPLVQNAKTVFGWSDQGTSPLVRINVLGTAVIAPSGQVPDGPVPNKVIDIEGIDKASFILEGTGQGEGGQPL